MHPPKSDGARQTAEAFASTLATWGKGVYSTMDVTEFYKGKVEAARGDQALVRLRRTPRTASVVESTAVPFVQNAPFAGRRGICGNVSPDPLTRAM
jgi:hypothetical protein